MITASHFNEVTNGYERQTSGLWLHRGNLMAPTGFFDVGSLRVSKNLMPPGGYKGEGIEFLYAGDVGYIQSIDRDVGVSRPLSISGSPVSFPGGVDLPANTSTALLHTAVGVLSYSLAATGVWTQTTWVTPSLACRGRPLLIYVSFPAYHTAAGGAWYYALGLDGAFHVNMGFSVSTAANYIVMCSFLVPVTPSAGNHVFSLWAYNANTGSFNIWNQANSVFIVLELRA